MIDGNIDIVTLTGQITDTVSLEGELLPIGPKGDQGDPGFSPVVTTSKSGKTTTVKFETATGNVYAYIQDGEDGQGSGDMMTDVYDQNKNGIVDNAEKVNGKTVETNVPASAIFTDENAVWGNITGTLSNQTDLSTALGNKVNTSSIGVASGIAELDENGKVPSSQLPSYVDDVIEGYYYNSKFYQDLSHTIEITGEAGKIYVDLVSNKTYRWGGTEYAEISSSLALGETNSTAYRGDRGKTAYDHSQTTSGNPHNVTKSDIGLGNVGNFKAVSTEANQGLSSTEKSNARTNIGAGTSSFSGSYNDLSNKPSIPTKTSDLTNDENFISEVDIQDNLLNVYTSVDTDYRVNFLSSRNLFDKDTMVINAAIDSGNGYMESSNNFRTIYIPCKSNTTYTISKIVSNRFIIGYTTDNNVNIPKTLINPTSVNTSTTSYTFTTPNNSKYVFIMVSKITDDTTNINDLLDSIQIEQGDIASPYEEFIQKTINVDDTKFSDTLNVGLDINTANRLNVLHSKNLFDKNNIVSNYRLSSDGILYADDGYFASDFIKVKPNTTYITNIEPTGYKRMCEYNSSKTFLLGRDNPNTNQITTSANTQYIKISGLLTELNTTMLVEGNTIGDYEPYITPSINVDGEEIYNANIMTYDSAERVIGTWFGKPLYRKAFEITGYSSSNTDYVDVSSLNIEKAVKLYGYYKKDVGYFDIPLYDSAENYSVLFVSSSNKIRGRFGTPNAIIEAVVILEYTKTS